MAENLLKVNQGGTGTSTNTNHGVMIGQGANAVATTGAGTAGQVLMSNGASADPTFQTLINKYAATVANCSNTAAETTVFSVTIPANTWLAGETVSVSIPCLHKQNSGGSLNLTLKIKVNGTSYTALSASAVSNNATEGKTDRGFTLRRVGNDLWLNAQAPGGVGGYRDSVVAASITQDSFSSTSGNVFTSVTFSSDIVITFTVQWSGASSLAYFNPQWGYAVKV